MMEYREEVVMEPEEVEMEAGGEIEEYEIETEDVDESSAIRPDFAPVDGHLLMV